MFAMEDMIDEFESLRRRQETQNEKIINYVQAVHYGVVALANVATHFVSVAPYSAPMGLIALLTFACVSRIGLIFYFRLDPPYRSLRKYYITSFDLFMLVVAAWMLLSISAYRVDLLAIFAVCIFSMLIVLSGLRYSFGVVMYTGIVSLLLHGFIFVPQQEWLMIGPVLTIGSVTLSTVTLGVGYSVTSLVRMHREAVLKQQLARFLPADLVEQVVLQPHLLERSTQRKEATVIFTDIRGFTRFSEAMPAERVVEFLNEFLEEMTLAIMEYDGMLNKYIGDAVMGVFGVPFNSERHAVRALQAALSMQARLIQLNKSLVERGLPELSIGIGLHTGELLIGAIGSKQQLDYTVIGDTVNTASRIEGLTRNFPVEILVSESTKDAIGEFCTLYRIAEVSVKNRDQPLTVWSPDPPVSDAAQS